MRTCVRMRWESQNVELRRRREAARSRRHGRAPVRRAGGAGHALPRGPHEVGPEPRPGRHPRAALRVDDQSVPRLHPCLRLLRLSRHADPARERPHAPDRRPAGRRRDLRHGPRGRLSPVREDRGARALVDGQIGGPSRARGRDRTGNERRSPLSDAAGLEARPEQRTRHGPGASHPQRSDARDGRFRHRPGRGCGLSPRVLVRRDPRGWAHWFTDLRPPRRWNLAASPIPARPRRSGSTRTRAAVSRRARDRHLRIPVPGGRSGISRDPRDQSSERSCRGSDPRDDRLALARRRPVEQGLPRGHLRCRRLLQRFATHRQHGHGDRRTYARLPETARVPFDG